MLVYKDKSFMINPEHPNDKWLANADFVIPDDSELAEKIKHLYPNFDFVLDDGKPVDVVETEPQPEPEKPPEPPSRAELAAAIAELAEVMFGG